MSPSRSAGAASASSVGDKDVEVEDGSDLSSVVVVSSNNKRTKNDTDATDKKKHKGAANKVDLD